MKRIGLILIVYSILSFPLLSQTVSIPDTAFLRALIDEEVDSDGDSLISNTEAEAINSLSIPSYNISDLTGIEAFVNLDTLNCYDNSLTSLDVSNNIALIDLNLGSNELSAIDVSNNTALTDLDLSWNDISTLDISNNTELTELDLVLNKLSAIDISNNTALTDLSLGSNDLSSLDVSNNTSLEWLTCWRNEITSLDISLNPELIYLSIKENLLDSLNVSSNTALKYLICGGNQLTRLDVTNNTSLKSLRIEEMPTLACVSVWELPFPPEGVEVDTTDSPNVVFTTDYCSGVDVEDYSQTGLSIYPNPAIDILTIESDAFEHYSINITSLNGQIMYNTMMEGTNHQIDLLSFPKGVYLITIRSEYFVTTEKLIKL